MWNKILSNNWVLYGYPPPRLGATGVLNLSSRRVIYAPSAPSSLSLFSFRDLKSARRPCARPWTLRSSPGFGTPLGPPRCFQDASKMPLVCHHFLDVFCIDFQSIFDANLAPTCLRKSMKIHEKSMPRAIPILHSSFIDFWSICVRFFDHWNLIF